MGYGSRSARQGRSRRYCSYQAVSRRRSPAARRGGGSGGRGVGSGKGKERGVAGPVGDRPRGGTSNYPRGRLVYLSRMALAAAEVSPRDFFGASFLAGSPGLAALASKAGISKTVLPVGMLSPAAAAWSGGTGSPSRSSSMAARASSSSDIGAGAATGALAGAAGFGAAGAAGLGAGAA